MIHQLLDRLLALLLSLPLLPLVLLLEDQQTVAIKTERSADGTLVGHRQWAGLAELVKVGLIALFHRELLVRFGQTAHVLLKMRSTTEEELKVERVARKGVGEGKKTEEGGKEK